MVFTIVRCWVWVLRKLFGPKNGNILFWPQSPILGQNFDLWFFRSWPRQYASIKPLNTSISCFLPFYDQMSSKLLFWPTVFNTFILLLRLTRWSLWTRKNRPDFWLSIFDFRFFYFQFSDVHCCMYSVGHMAGSCHSAWV